MSGCIPENIELPINKNGNGEVMGEDGGLMGEIPDSRAVDLGLSVKWASCNVGATSPEGYGGYYAWGETEEKTYYSWNTYKWCNGSSSSLTKYCTDSSYDIVDNKTTLDLEDDVAHVKWGGNWRMPTEPEMDELCNSCSWSWTSVNGVNGYQVTGPNGNSIFLPAAGLCKYREDVGARGTYAYYWSATLSSDDSEDAYELCSYDGCHCSASARYFGAPVRPVYGEYKPQDITVTTGDALKITSNRAELSGSLSSSSQLLKCGIIYGTSSTLSSTNGRKEYAASREYRNFTIEITGLSDNTTYYYCTFALIDGGYKYGEVRSFTTDNFPEGAVDLGLPSGLLWASCNVGATSPEEYGGYYAWGEVEEKTDYSWSTHKWCNGSYDTQTKYCTNSYHGTVDNKTTLDPEDDVAHVQWGGDWRMPTSAEQDELRTECSWFWTSVNGVNGYQVTGPNGNSIFLPAAGLRSGEDIKYRGTRGDCWSATMCFDSHFAYSLNFGNGYYKYFNLNRSLGLPVRPITE